MKSRITVYWSFIPCGKNIRLFMKLWIQCLILRQRPSAAVFFFHEANPEFLLQLCKPDDLQYKKRYFRSNINFCASPTGIYLLQVNNRNTRIRCEICSKLTIKTPERQLCYSPMILTSLDMKILPVSFIV